MKMMKVMPIVLCAGLAPGLADAMPDDFIREYAITKADLDQGRPLDARGLGFMAAAEVTPGMLVLEEVSLDAGDGRFLEAREVTVSGNTVLLRDAVLSRNARNEEFGRVAIDVTRIEGPHAHRLPAMIGREICNSASDRPGDISRIEASGITLTAPSLAAGLSERAPIPVGTPESVEIEGLEVELAMSAEAECASLRGVSLRDAVTATQAGDRLSVAGMKLDIQPRVDLLDVGVQVDEVSFMDQAGTAPTSLDHLTMAAILPADWLEEDGIPHGAIDFLTALAARDISVAIELGGIDIPIGTLASQRILTRTGATRDTRFEGGANFSLASANGRITVAHDMSLSALAASSGEAVIDYDPSSAMGSDPRMAFVTGTSVVSALLSHRDGGLDAMMRNAVGLGLGELARQTIEASAVPGRISKPVAAWFETALGDRGEAVISPDKPVGLMRLGMLAALSPDALAGQLGLSVE